MSTDPSRSRPIEEVLQSEKLRYLSGDDFASVREGAPLREAVELLQDDKSVGAVLIFKRSRSKSKGRKVVGIFTERDYLDKLAGAETDFELPVDQFMTRDPQTVSPDDTIDRAIKLMTRGGYRHLPVADKDGSLVGLVSTRDIVVYLAEFFPMEVYNLPPRLHPAERISTREGG